MDPLTQPDDRPLWWSDRTGRGLHLAHERRRDIDLNSALRRRLVDLGLAGTPDLRTWVVCRSRCVLLLPDLPALWVADPDRHTASGHAYRALALTPEALAVWRASNNARTVIDIAARVGLAPDVVLAVVGQWTVRTVQAAQLRAGPARAADPGLARIVGAQRPNHVRTADQRGPQGGTDLRHYHLHHITDGQTHFDDRETTLAHAFAPPHAALNHASYGARLRQRLTAFGWSEDGPTVELGCGDGELARDWGPSNAGYLRIDLSPVLLGTQATTAPRTHGLLADALALPLRAGSVSRLVCNEVMADLPSVPVDAHDPEVSTRLQQYALTPSTHGWHNLGAWRLLEGIVGVLAPGGRAVLTEFGTLQEPVQQAVQLDHPEVGIHFGQLTQVAQALGLETQCVPLAELLAFAPGARWLSRPSWLALRARAAAMDVRLPARAWTPAALAEAVPFAVEHLSWAPCTSPGPGPDVTRFYALLLRKR